MKIATKDTIEGACVLAQVMGCHEDDEIVCGTKHCESCYCRVKCEHGNSWECASAALGIELDSVDLWLSASNAVNCAIEIATDGGVDLEDDQIESAAGLVVKSRPLGEHGIRIDEYETESLLRAGWLPRGWRHT